MDLNLTQVLLLTEILTSPSDLAILCLLTFAAFLLTFAAFLLTFATFLFEYFIHSMSALTIGSDLVLRPFCDPENGLESHTGLALD